MCAPPEGILLDALHDPHMLRLLAAARVAGAGHGSLLGIRQPGCCAAAAIGPAAGTRSPVAAEEEAAPASEKLPATWVSSAEARRKLEVVTAACSRSLLTSTSKVPPV